MNLEGYRGVNALKQQVELKENHDYTTIDPAAFDNNAFVEATEGGHLDVLKYLRELKNRGYDNIRVE